MKYIGGEQIKAGDIVEIDIDYHGRVVGVIDTFDFVAGFESSDWSYLDRGILVDTNFSGLTHYDFVAAEPSIVFMSRSRELSLSFVGLTLKHIIAIESLRKMDDLRIDEILKGKLTRNWQKCSKVVGLAMMSDSELVAGIPDIYYFDRLLSLSRNLRIEVSGSIQDMKTCEIRLFD